MTMPVFDDSDTPRLGEIARTLDALRQEVRNSLQDVVREFRNSLQEMVRKDVYQVSNTALEGRILALEVKLRDAEAQGKSRSNLLYGTALTAGVSLLGWVLTAIAGSMA